MSKNSGLPSVREPGQASQLAIAFPDRVMDALSAELDRIEKGDALKRGNGGTSLHIIGRDGMISGFVKDEHTTIRFSGGAVAVSTHD
jgi:hypothetical protein